MASVGIDLTRLIYMGPRGTYHLNGLFTWGLGDLPSKPGEHGGCYVCIEKHEQYVMLGRVRSFGTLLSLLVPWRPLASFWHLFWYTFGALLARF